MQIHRTAVTMLACTPALSGAVGGNVSEEPEKSLLELAIDDEVTMKLFGRLFIDWGWFSGDSPTYASDPVPTGTTPELEDGTEFRAARMGIDGTLYERVYYKVEYDLAPGEPEAKDVYLALKETPVGEIRAGHFKEPFSLEQLTSSRFITFMERSVADAFAPGRNGGIQLAGHDDAQRVTWAAGLFRTTDDFAFGVGDSEYGYTGRLTGTPWREEDGSGLLHLGGAVSYRTDDTTRFRARPEAHLLNRPADTGAIASDDTALIGLESAWVGGPLSLQAELQRASVDATGAGADGDFSGFYGFVSWFLTGEHRAYKASSGTFERVKPAENFGAGSGALELALRYSTIDLDDGPSTDEMTDTTAGVNWYLNPNARVMLNYVHSEFESGAVDDSADLLMLRLQVDW